jgi:hypothetical protein
MRENPLGESENGVLRSGFDRTLRLEFHGSRITSDAGLIAYRELDEVFGLTESAGKNLLDRRTGSNTRHAMTAMLQQSVFGRLAGYEDTNDAERLSDLFAIRLPANKRLQDQIGHLLTRPVGRPPRKPIVRYHSFKYKTKSWKKVIRVVAKVEWHRGELFPRVGFIVTNLRRSAEAVVRFYSGRGLAAQWIKEWKNALKWTRLSCHDFADLGRME